jgi:hypothetical protein
MITLDENTMNEIKKAIENGKSPKIKIKTKDGWYVFKYVTEEKLDKKNIT